MQPNLAASYRARFLGLGALIVAGVITFLATRPPAPPDAPVSPVGRCYGRAHR